MNKAAQLSRTLERVDMAQALKIIEGPYADALHFDVIENAMCVMHDDGSVNIFDIRGNGVFTSEVISSANILKVLHHYRPFKGVLTNSMQ